MSYFIIDCKSHLGKNAANSTDSTSIVRCFQLQEILKCVKMCILKSEIQSQENCFLCSTSGIFLLFFKKF